MSEDDPTNWLISTCEDREVGSDHNRPFLLLVERSHESNQVAYRGTLLDWRCCNNFVRDDSLS
jgi:hypothetical protein